MSVCRILLFYFAHLNIFFFIAPDSWNVADVGEWLSSRDLAQYVPNFKDNVIDGKVLMELSLQDLDYMGITALGHRKTILKGIEELNAGGNRKVSRTHTFVSTLIDIKGLLNL